MFQLNSHNFKKLIEKNRHAVTKLDTHLVRTAHVYASTLLSPEPVKVKHTKHKKVKKVKCKKQKLKHAYKSSDEESDVPKKKRKVKKPKKEP